MSRRLDVRVERWETAGAFVIARGARTHVDVVVVQIVQDHAKGRVCGRGEATPVYYRGETPESVAEAIGSVQPDITRAELLDLLPAGAARNAVDAALWDLEAKAAGKRVWELIGLPRPRPMLTAYTISLGEPGAMEAAARKVAGRELLKLKLSGEGIVERVTAVRRGAPDARLIVDANEAWENVDIERVCVALAKERVELIEQPVPAGRDALLDGLRTAVPLAADESCHDRPSLDAVIGRYRYINIKLDKAGGLTEALALAHAGKLRGLGLMTGCMLSTSLGIAPAFHVAMTGEYADLDGPLLLSSDREHGMGFAGSDVEPPARELWG